MSLSKGRGRDGHWLRALFNDESLSGGLVLIRYCD